MFENIKKQWTTLFEAAVFLVAAVLAFVIVPPRLTPAGDASWVHAAEFIGAIVIAIVVIAARHRRWGVRTLLIATAATLICAVVAFFAYRMFLSLWTCGDYDGRGAIVIGSKMLPDAANYAAQQHANACTVIQDFAGDTASIWEASELLSRYLLLAAAFVSTVLLFLAAAVLAIEAIRAHLERPPSP
jgi:hypothetical protein